MNELSVGIHFYINSYLLPSLVVDAILPSPPHIDLVEDISEFPGILSSLLHEVIYLPVTGKTFFLSFLRPLCLSQGPLKWQVRQDRASDLVGRS